MEVLAIDCGDNLYCYCYLIFVYVEVKHYKNEKTESCFASVTTFVSVLLIAWKDQEVISPDFISVCPFGCILYFHTPLKLTVTNQVIGGKECKNRICPVFSSCWLSLFCRPLDLPLFWYHFELLSNNWIITVFPTEIKKAHKSGRKPS